MKYKLYPNYKDSGIDWLDKIPEHWNIGFISTLFDENKEKNYGNKEKNLLSLSYGRIINKDIDSTFGLLPESFESYQIVKPGYIVLRLTDLQNDKKSLRTGLVIKKGIITSAYIALKKKSNNTDEEEYFHYFLHAFDKHKGFYGMGAGVRQSLNYDELKKLRFILPSTQEQQFIVSFLDKATDKIDALISKQEKLIELLKEKRQAVISHAVTKGLDANVKMKDGGIEWLGRIPEHWEICPLKYFASMKGGFAFSTEDFTDTGVQIIKISNVYQNRFSLERDPTFVSLEVAKKYKEFALKCGDLILSLTGTLGKRDYGYTVMVNDKGRYLLNQRVAKLSPNNRKISTEFLNYLLKSEQYLAQIYSLPCGTKQANLSTSDVLGAFCAFPESLEEQDNIVKYLDNTTSNIDALIFKSEISIELLKEKKEALISAAVTGKIDVSTELNTSVREA